MLSILGICPNLADGEHGGERAIEFACYLPRICASFGQGWSGPRGSMLRNRLLGTAICVAFIAALPIAAIVATAQTGIAVPEMATCESYINNFVAREGVPGLSFALAREGRIVYSRGFGTADLAMTENTQPYPHVPKRSIRYGSGLSAPQYGELSEINSRNFEDARRSWASSGRPDGNRTGRDETYRSET